MKKPSSAPDPNRADKLQAFDRLLTVMNELRENCPWDKKQTLESLRHLTIEETYELSDAILEGDLNEVKKELGDLMLHNVFYARIASEQGKFDIAERYYDQALSLNPDYEQALVNKAALRLLKKDNKTAEVLLKRVLKMNPNNLEAQAALGRAKM